MQPDLTVCHHFLDMLDPVQTFSKAIVFVNGVCFFFSFSESSHTWSPKPPLKSGFTCEEAYEERGISGSDL